MAKEETQTLASAVAALEAATADYKDKLTVASAARRDETAALNNMNEAQRIVDGLLKKLRDTAPNDSDWGNSRRQQSRNA